MGAATEAELTPWAVRSAAETWAPVGSDDDDRRPCPVDVGVGDRRGEGPEQPGGVSCHQVPDEAPHRPPAGAAQANRLCGKRHCLRPAGVGWLVVLSESDLDSGKGAPEPDQGSILARISVDCPRPDEGPGFEIGGHPVRAGSKNEAAQYGTRAVGP